jgi:hypothetical protein
LAKSKKAMGDADGTEAAAAIFMIWIWREMCGLSRQKRERRFGGKLREATGRALSRHHRIELKAIESKCTIRLGRFYHCHGLLFGSTHSRSTGRGKS